jgi:hypothetical protein
MGLVVAQTQKQNRIKCLFSIAEQKIPKVFDIQAENPRKDAQFLFWKS